MRQSVNDARYPLRIPSFTHEARRAHLQTLADVAGFRIEVHFPSDDRPDVLRRLVNGRGVFLGEAKYSEGPSNMASVARLDRYLGWLLPVQQSGGSAVLAVAHSQGLEAAWRARLVWLAAGHRTDVNVWSASLARGIAVSVLAHRQSVCEGTVGRSGARYSVTESLPPLPSTAAG
jgi:hypothetical protein